MSSDFQQSPMRVGSAVKHVTQLIDISENTQFAVEAIDMDGYNLLQFRMPAAWTVGDVQVYVIHEENDLANPTYANYHPLFDSAGVQVAVTTPTVDQTYTFVGDMAAAIAASRYVILRSSVVQGADRTLEVILKG